MVSLNSKRILSNFDSETILKKDKFMTPEPFTAQLIITKTDEFLKNKDSKLSYSLKKLEKFLGNFIRSLMIVSELQ